MPKMLILLSSLVVLLSGAASAKEVKAGDKAPGFSLRDRAGRVFRLNDLVYPGPEKKQKPRRSVLLDFFSTDCAACRRELDQVIAFSKAHADTVTVVMVALLEPDDGAAKLDAFLASKPVPFQVVLDRYEAVAKDYVTAGTSVTLPGLFLIGPDGVVKQALFGFADDLEAALAEAVGSR